MGCGRSERKKEKTKVEKQRNKGEREERKIEKIKGKHKIKGRKYRIEFVVHKLRDSSNSERYKDSQEENKE